MSAGLCRWVDDYPYAYYKGNQTPGFVACLAHYVRVSGDLDLAHELSASVERCLAWCRSCTDADGRMLVERAGIAAVEAGPMAGRIECEIYLQGILDLGLGGRRPLGTRHGR